METQPNVNSSRCVKINRFVNRFDLPTEKLFSLDMANERPFLHLSFSSLEFVPQGGVTADEVLRKLARLGSALEQAEAGVASLVLVVAAATHVFEGLFSLAWDTENKTQQRNLKRACASVAALLKAPAVLRHATVLEKSLRAVRVLGQYGSEAFNTLIAGGACDGMSTLYVIADTETSPKPFFGSSKWLCYRCRLTYLSRLSLRVYSCDRCAALPWKPRRTSSRCPSVFGLGASEC